MTPLPPRAIIGVVHLRPLPGAPRFDAVTGMAAVLEAAAADARAYAQGGAHALVVENFGDVPFTRGSVAPETVAAMALASAAVREAAPGLPLGFNVLRNDARAALGLCAAAGGDFIRVNVHCGAAVADQGILEGDAYATLRCRAALCPGAAIFADIHVKHAEPLGGGSIKQAAREAVERGLADGLIVSGSGTGQKTDPNDLARVRAACPESKIFVGSGSDAESAPALLEFADGLIVGTAAKRGGILANPVEVSRVAAIVRAAAKA
ncbi:MAG: BtpA/SgcQ family protein [Verrucomicrobiales bacterium]